MYNLVEAHPPLSGAIRRCTDFTWLCTIGVAFRGIFLDLVLPDTHHLTRIVGGALVAWSIGAAMAAASAVPSVDAAKLKMMSSPCWASASLGTAAGV
jgi:hypothetical protein